MKLQSEKLNEFEGDLYAESFSNSIPIRKDYCKHFSRPKNLSQVKATLRAGELTFPGCYQLYLMTSDGAALCFSCARKEFRQVACDFLNNYQTGWKIDGCEINYEDNDLTCYHCGKSIPASYGE